LVPRNDRLEVLDYLKRSIQRIRDVAAAHSNENISSEMLKIADAVAADTAELEQELIDAGYLPKSA
jgi:hypothetical protein